MKSILILLALYLVEISTCYPIAQNLFGDSDPSLMGSSGPTFIFGASTTATNPVSNQTPNLNQLLHNFQLSNNPTLAAGLTLNPGLENSGNKPVQGKKQQQSNPLLLASLNFNPGLLTNPATSTAPAQNPQQNQANEQSAKTPGLLGTAAPLLGGLGQTLDNVVNGIPVVSPLLNGLLGGLL